MEPKQPYWPLAAKTGVVSSAQMEFKGERAERKRTVREKGRWSDGITGLTFQSVNTCTSDFCNCAQPTAFGYFRAKRQSENIT